MDQQLSGSFDTARLEALLKDMSNNLFPNDELKPGIYFFIADDGELYARGERFPTNVESRFPIWEVKLDHSIPDKLKAIVNERFGIHTSWIGGPKGFYVAVHDPITRKPLVKTVFPELNDCFDFVFAVQPKS